MAELNELYGSNTIKKLMEKDELLCIRRTYFLLYQSLIPNCKVTIGILREHCEVASDVEQYILNGGSARLRCQQLLNFLLVRLSESKDYMEFYKFIQLTSVLSNLSVRMISEFQKSKFWSSKTPLSVQPKVNVSSCATHAISETDGAIAFHCLSACCSINQWEALEDRASKSAYDTINNRRLIKQNPKPTANMGPLMNQPLHKCKDLALIEVYYVKVLELLPDNYEYTLNVLQDNFTDELIVAILSCNSVKEANKIMLDSLVRKVKNKEDILEMCDKLGNINGSIELLGVLLQIRNAIRNLSLMRPYSAVILKYLPDDYMNTLDILQDHLNDDCICAVLSSPDINVETANKLMLDCLIESHIEDVIGFCDVIEKISTVINLMDCLRQGWKEVEATVDNPVLLSKSKLDTVNPHVNEGILFDETFQRLMLTSNSKVVPLLKKYYSVFWHSLPQDCMITMPKLKKLLNVPDDIIADLLSYSNTVIINERIVASIIVQIRSEESLLDYCDLFEQLVDPESKVQVESFRNEVLTLLTANDESLQVSPVNPILQVGPQSHDQTRNSTMIEGSHVTTTQLPPDNTTTGLNSFRADNEKNKRPELRDVYRYVVPQYAHKWRQLGAQLCFNQPELDIVFSNFCNDSEECCRNLMHRWLNKNADATWSQLLTAIDDLPQESYTIKFQQPPVLPPNYIPRHELLEELVSAVMKAELEPNRFGSTVTVTGVGGFGKSVLAKALCHHDVIKAKFKCGFVFVELGPKAYDPVVALHQLYHLLTGKEFPVSQSTNTSIVVKEIRQLTKNLSDKLLVVIDDVWHIEDAKSIIEAFNNCKTIITTRENEINELIPPKYNIIAGPMKPNEAISLLTTGVIPQTQLSENDHTSLDNIAHDVHLWPLLLSLVRGQLSHHFKQQGMLLYEGIRMVHQNLHAKGLTAFDKRKVNSNIGNRNSAVKACIEATLDLLVDSESSKLNVLILYAGIGCPIPTAALQVLWKVSPLEADNVVTTLWGHGLITYTFRIIPCFVYKQHHIEVHATISQFILENMDGKQVVQLVPIVGSSGLQLNDCIAHEFEEDFRRCCGLPDISSLNNYEYLKHWLNALEYNAIPFHLKDMNMWNNIDPHMAIVHLLEPLLEFYKPCENALSQNMFYTQITLRIDECKKVILDVCRSKKTPYQLSMKYLVEHNYDGLLQELEDYCIHYPMGPIAEKSVKMINEVIPFCDGNNHFFLSTVLEHFRLMTLPYHTNMFVYLPTVKSIVNMCRRISYALETNNSNEIKKLVDYIKSGDLNEEWEKIHKAYFKLMGKIAPHVSLIANSQLYLTGGQIQ